MSLAVVARLGSAWIAPIAVATAAERPSNLGIVVLVVALLVGIPLAYRLYREAHADDERETDADMLSEFQQAYDAGEMDEEEFRRVRALLIGAGGRRPGSGRTEVRPGPPRIVPGGTVPDAAAGPGTSTGGPVVEPEGPTPPPSAEPGPNAPPD